MSSEHDVKVVQLGPIEKHPDADSLGIVDIEGKPVIVRLDDWHEGAVAIYVPVDSLVLAADPTFAFLAARSKPNSEGRIRVKAVRLRGIFSMGLLVPSPPDLVAEVGAIVGERMDITVYEPPETFGGGDIERDPGFLPVYDIEGVRKWGREVLVDGEEVVLTEKIHGANGRYCFHNGQFWAASRTMFKKEESGGLWWEAAIRAGLPGKLVAAPGFAVYGEVFGQVQDLKYGQPGVSFRAFDVLDIETRCWLDFDAFNSFCRDLDIPTVPILYRGPWSEDLYSLAEGKSTIYESHCREGWVVKPVVERYARSLGRVILKLAGQDYLLRKGG